MNRRFLTETASGLLEERTHRGHGEGLLVPVDSQCDKAKRLLISV